MFQESPATFLADFGVWATTGSNAGLVLLDMPGQQVLGDTYMATEYAITYNPADLPGLKYGDTLTIYPGQSATGTPTHYKVRVANPLDDGALWHAVLERT